MLMGKAQIQSFRMLSNLNYQLKLDCYKYKIFYNAIKHSIELIYRIIFLSSTVMGIRAISSAFL